MLGSSQRSRLIFLLLTGAAAIYLTSSLITFQNVFIQGDHGRDFYAAQVTAQGQLPYKDYFWPYGPLMPYFYAMMFEFFGESIQSILLGKVILIILSALLFYATLSLFVPPILSFVATLWFIQYRPEFVFTYNHIGGIVLLNALLYCILAYLKYNHTRTLFVACLLCFAAILIKPNIGLACLFFLLISVVTIDFFKPKLMNQSKIIFYGLSLLGVPFVSLGIYWFLAKDLPTYQFLQCFPYFYEFGVKSLAVKDLIIGYIKNTQFQFTLYPSQLFYFTLILTCTILAIRRLCSSSIDERQKQVLWIALGLCFFGSIIFMHEYFASGIIYRSYWAAPFQFTLAFLLIGISYQFFSPRFKVILIVFFLTLVGISHYGRMHWRNYFKTKSNSQYLLTGGHRTYAQNHRDWFDTIIWTTDYLNKNLAEGEQFFAVPYDPIYYFLTNRPSPTQELVLFDYYNIWIEQEEQIIKTLEDKKINTILLSSRLKSTERGLGTFGVTHCLLLNQYIEDNFEEVARYGSWEKNAGQYRGHATRILKRKK